METVRQPLTALLDDQVVDVVRAPCRVATWFIRREVSGEHWSPNIPLTSTFKERDRELVPAFDETMMGVHQEGVLLPFPSSLEQVSGPVTSPTAMCRDAVQPDRSVLF